MIIASTKPFFKICFGIFTLLPCSIHSAETSFAEKILKIFHSAPRGWSPPTRIAQENINGTVKYRRTIAGVTKTIDTYATLTDQSILHITRITKYRDKTYTKIKSQKSYCHIRPPHGNREIQFKSNAEALFEIIKLAPFSEDI